MNEAVERTKVMMDEAWESWKKMYGGEPWWFHYSNGAALNAIEPWLASWRSASDFHNRSWKSFRENVEAAMLKIMKESKLCFPAQEEQVREYWNRVNESAGIMEEQMHDLFERWEAMMKPKRSAE